MVVSAESLQNNPEDSTKARVRDACLLGGEGGVVFYGSDGMQPLGHDAAFP